MFIYLTDLAIEAQNIHIMKFNTSAVVGKKKAVKKIAMLNAKPIHNPLRTLLISFKGMFFRNRTPLLLLQSEKKLQIPKQPKMYILYRIL